MRKHELLAPAGSLEICKAVIASGADAVYLGGEKYGARAFAQNFSREEILEALDFAHLYGRKIFLTVNTLLKNREQDGELFSYIKPYYERGLDAVIVQDYGVFQFLKRNFPDLPLHVSTQASVSNVYGAKFFLEQGVARIVPSRELSLAEIRRIYEETGAELECFVHGALCYSYSGQCLMSSLLGGRSGNRGRCAQPCRLAYEVIDEREAVLHKKEKYPLSPKDLNTLEILPKLCEAGVYSFKIEGRMKSLEYAAGVTSVYRRYLDLYERISGEHVIKNEELTCDSGLAYNFGNKGNCSGERKMLRNHPALVADVRHGENYAVAEEDLQYLFDLGNRNGFTKGYYEMRSGRAMMTLTDSSHASAGAKEVYQPAGLAKIPVSGKVEMRVGEPMRLELRCDRNVPYELETVQNDREGENRSQTVNPANFYDEKFENGPGNHCDGRLALTVLGTAVSEAKNRPLTADDVRTRFSRTGDTPFEMKNLEVVLDGGCFAPVGQMNELRRQGLALLQERMLAPYRRELAENAPFDGAGRQQKSAGAKHRDSAGAQLQGESVEQQKINVGFITQKNSTERRLNSKIEQENPALDVWVSNAEQLEAVLDVSFVDTVTLDFSDIAVSSIDDAKMIAGNLRRERQQEKCKSLSRNATNIGNGKDRFVELLEYYRRQIVASGMRAAFALPHVFRENSSAVYRKKECREALSRFDLLWVRSYDELGFFMQDAALGNIALDDHLYIFSGESAAAFLALGVNRYTVSPELNRKELAHMPNARAEFPIYGYTPVMISAQCVYKNYDGCRKQAGNDSDATPFRENHNRRNYMPEGSLFLRDRYFKKFFVYKNCADCYNVIYNSQPLFLLHQTDEVKRLGFGSHRISFTREGADDVRRVLTDYKRAFLGGERVKPPGDDFTTGHFRRGVE